MADESSERVFRVTVRGRFGDVGDDVRGYLVAAQPEHDIFVSAFTREGTFTYDQRIDFFNLRYEVRGGGDDPAGDAQGLALTEAERFLRTMRFAHRGLKADVVDMSAIWADVELRRRR